MSDIQIDRVRVAVRIRPFAAKETADPFISTVPTQPQVRIKDSNELFTYDHVFDEDTTQSEVYNRAIAQMVNKIFDGYNVSISLLLY